MIYHYHYHCCHDEYCEYDSVFTSQLALYMFILSHHLYKLSVMDKLCPQTVVLLRLWLVHISTLRIYTESQSDIGCFLAS